MIRATIVFATAGLGLANMEGLSHSLAQSGGCMQAAMANGQMAVFNPMCLNEGGLGCIEHNGCQYCGEGMYAQNPCDLGFSGALFERAPLLGSQLFSSSRQPLLGNLHLGQRAKLLGNRLRASKFDLGLLAGSDVSEIGSPVTRFDRDSKQIVEQTMEMETVMVPVTKYRQVQEMEPYTDFESRTESEPYQETITRMRPVTVQEPYQETIQEPYSETITKFRPVTVQEPFTEMITKHRAITKKEPYTETITKHRPVTITKHRAVTIMEPYQETIQEPYQEPITRFRDITIQQPYQEPITKHRAVTKQEPYQDVITKMRPVSITKSRTVQVQQPYQDVITKTRQRLVEVPVTKMRPVVKQEAYQAQEAVTSMVPKTIVKTIEMEQPITEYRFAVRGPEVVTGSHISDVQLGAPQVVDTKLVEGDRSFLLGSQFATSSRMPLLGSQFATSSRMPLLGKLYNRQHLLGSKVFSSSRQPLLGGQHFLSNPVRQYLKTHRLGN